MQVLAVHLVECRVRHMHCMTGTTGMSINFPRQVDDLLMYLNDAMPADHLYQGLKATPITESAPPVWMLGSSPKFCLLRCRKRACRICLRSLSTEKVGPRHAKHYRKSFQPSEACKNQSRQLLFSSPVQKQKKKPSELSLHLTFVHGHAAQGMPFKRNAFTRKSACYIHTVILKTTM